MIIMIIVDLVLAGIAGWLAGKIMKYDKSVLWNIVLGLVGGIVGSAIIGLFGLSAGGLVGSLIVSIIGACVLVWLARLIIK